MTDYVKGIQKAENDRKEAARKAAEEAKAKQKEIETLDKLLNPQSAFGYEVREKLASAEKYASLTGQNADTIKGKTISDYRENILKELEGAGVVGAKIIDGIINASGVFSEMPAYSCGYESNVSALKSIANKRIESAYGYGQGQLIVDYQKATEIAKQQDKQAEAIKVAN